MSSFADEMRLFDNHGNRLYLNADERARFLAAAKDLEPHYRVACEVLHYTGCRISELLEVSAQRVSLADKTLTFRTLKKRRLTRDGREKKPEYRAVPVPDELVSNLDLVFQVRRRRGPALNEPFWPVRRLTLWRQVKKAMDAAGIAGPQATAKGLRHGYGTAMTLAGMDIYLLAQRLGHANAATTQIYRQAVGEDDHRLQMQYWEKADAQ